ncbi:HTTM domain-containing protein [Spirosoma sp. HMF4905]|uniref:HTTM domain-containing protein n=1 Tax=Spirosoma arboris TaxID=2682092 RepID=A0A7K1SCF4_9BACT|nr:HTTM domain-containing protein [Spirosoma arboris]MVM31497.1 HTTM domain-containing protein [Spirosoma arboris]
MMATNLSLNSQSTAEPYALAFFRISFGLLMLVAELRFINRDWVYAFYVKPQFLFTFYGFDWIKPLSEPYIYWLFYGLVILSFLITIGLVYRFAIIAFFLAFTYVELLDKSVYLNHYYQVSLLAFLMCWLPMNTVFSIDNWLAKKLSFYTLRVLKFAPFSVKPNSLKAIIYNPVWALRLQVGSVYFFGGIAKLKYDWLFMAQPLRIWLAANEHLPVVGPLLTEKWVAFLLSWLAMLFDLSVPFLLSFRQTRLPVFIVIVVFHVLTHFLFYIGMFPWMMIATVLIFFPPELFQRILRFFDKGTMPQPQAALRYTFSPIRLILPVFFLLQLILPFRSHAYSGNVLWHEQGFRFSWNIMLMEKNASLEYFVKVKKTGKEFTVKPIDFLTRIQARQMSFQPDMILQFAHYLHDYYLTNGVGDTEIRAECYASLNGRGSALLIDPTVDLAAEKEGFQEKNWINKL